MVRLVFNVVNVADEFRRGRGRRGGGGRDAGRSEVGETMPNTILSLPE